MSRDSEMEWCEREIELVFRYVHDLKQSSTILITKLVSYNVLLFQSVTFMGKISFKLVILPQLQ